MDFLDALTSSASLKPPPTYADDVFSAFTYTGNSSTQTITNGLDLAGKGGLVWIKNRASAGGDNSLMDTARGAANQLRSNLTNASVSAPTLLTAFGSSGFTLGAGSLDTNTSSNNYVSWAFRKAEKFFDVVTYTGNGSTYQSINHSLGIQPGMIMTKRTNSADDWAVVHRGTGANGGHLVKLNTTAAGVVGAFPYSSAPPPTASQFTVSNQPGASWDNNVSGAPYVALVFAHDAAADGLIQCGEYTDGASPQLINLGWEPQFLLSKRVDNVGVWRMVDASRGFVSNNGQNPLLQAQASDMEGSVTANSPHALGFTAGTATGQTYIYVAIRRPNKPPTTGAQVFNAVARSGTGGVATISGVGFAPDMQWANVRNGVGNHTFVDRLRGMTKALQSFNGNIAEVTWSDTITALTMDGATLGNGASSGNANFSSGTYINWFFKRAPGVFDEVCYTGSGSNTTQAHNLTVAPELMLVKQRSGTQLWACYASGIANSEYLVPSGTDAKTSGATYWNSTAPTSSVFSVGTAGAVNTAAATYVALLFATLPGVSKVGSYTGNGGSQTIACGFTTGARFIMIKRTDAVGDWYVWDTVRGVIAGNDPHLSLNTMSGEVTGDDTIDPDTSGFIVNQVGATNVNVSAATYIFFAIA